MLHYIYAIRNKINNKYYIGLTNNPRRRRNRHFTDLRCNRHDNKYLQQAFNKYGESAFEFIVLLEIECSREEISRIEQEYVMKYDSFRNGYNLNAGGFQNNGFESKLKESDVFNILSVLEFGGNFSGGALAEIYEVSRTTISRIKKGESHQEYKKNYESLPMEYRKLIYKGFCKDFGFYEIKNKTTSRLGKRILTKEQVFMIFSVLEFGYRKIKPMAKKLNISAYTIQCVRDGLTYKYEYNLYNKMTQQERYNLYDKAIKYFGFDASSCRNAC